MFDLVAHGPDTYVGTGPRYPWGGLYGGQIVAQALRAAALSVEPEYCPHSIRAYFIRRGDADEPVRYEVDRIRNGRSFVTRRVVARQAIGAILNAEVSFQRPEDSPVVQPIVMPPVPGPGEFDNSSFSERFERRNVPASALIDSPRDGAGRQAAWFRALDDLAEVPPGDSSLLHECWLAYMSDDQPTSSVFNAVRESDPRSEVKIAMTVSLDHTIWYHRPMRADEWHLFDVACHHVSSSRGLAFAHVFTGDGAHVASFAQEVLLRTTPQNDAGRPSG